MTKQHNPIEYAGAEIAVTLRQTIKRGGVMAVYRMDYPFLHAALKSAMTSWRVA